MTQAALAALHALPLGSTRGTFQNRPYNATKTTYANGKSVKLVARELGGPDYISLNAYLLESGPRLYPCEMPLEKVVRFLIEFSALS